MWTFQDSRSAIFVTRSGVGLRENVATGVTLLVISPSQTVQFVDRSLGRAPQPARNNVPPTRSFGPGPQTVPPRNFGNGPPPGAGVGPMSADVGKRDEGGDLVQALSLLQKIMTPEDFDKYQLLISPKQKQNKNTREQELADKVKSQEKLRSQEASHKGQIDKLELDLQRHRDMLQGVLERIRAVDDEIKDLRVQVAKEKSDSSDGDNASIRTAPATQVDSQPDIGESGLVVGPTAPTPLNPGPFESCDEDMLFDASEAEDEREVRRNGIWEPHRSGVIKKGKLLKYKEKAKAKQNKSIIIEEQGEGPPPGLPNTGKHLAEVLASLSQEGLKKVLSHCPPSLLQIVSSFGDPWVFSNSFKVVTHSSSCDFKPLFVGSSIEAPSSSSNGPVSGRSMIAIGASSLVARSMRDPGSSSSALRSQSSNGAGCPMFGHGYGSFSSSSLAVKSTRRKSAGSCDPGTCSSVRKGQGWNSSKSSDFADLFVSILLTRWCRCHLHRTHTTCMGT